MGTRIRYDTFFSNRPNPPGVLAMRHFLISTLLLSLVAGCSSVSIGPHRIDVQQGNALDQENVSRLKPGLNRSQVRFLLGTPLVVDPFRTDRWDYVYINYKAGKLAEQKRITLFFDGETLTRIEGDVPVAEPVEKTPAPAPTPVPVPDVEPKPKVEISTLPPVAETRPAPMPLVSQAEPVAKPASPPQPVVAPAQPENVAPVVAVPVVATVASKAADAPSASPEALTTAVPAATRTLVPPLPSPKNVPAYVDPRPPAELSLQPETDVEQLKPDVIPAFPEPHQATVASDDPVMLSLNAWADAWARRDENAYLAAYDASFVPEGGGRRSEWEQRRRLLLGIAKNIDLKIDSPSVNRETDSTATATFNQYYRSDSYRDSVVKQLRLVERDGRWLITEEKVVSVLRATKP
jgi:outer membrane protein assembly factor BamE